MGKVISDELSRAEEKLKKEVIDLKNEQGRLTKKFRTKLRDIQETMIKYNETLKGKNEEIVKLVDLKEEKCKFIVALEEAMEQKEAEINEVKVSREQLRWDLEQMGRNIERKKENGTLIYRTEFESKLNTRDSNLGESSFVKEGDMPHEEGTETEWREISPEGREEEVLAELKERYPE